MKQKGIYLKEITRPIEGVIKAGDENDINTEINEYVITAELAGLSKSGTMLPGLFEQLTQPSFGQCVWISGDFGSGKSHLLKMLSYVLENRTLDQTTCANIFADKAKDIDFEFEANIHKAAKIPTQCILFNIQANYDSITSKTKNDPILNVFLKVFNEKLGYDKSKPAMAAIERLIDQKGKLQFLYDEFPKRFGKEWTVARKNAGLQPQQLGEIYGEIEGISKEEATTTIRQSLSNYTLDIDGFADMIKEYVETQEPSFRLIFCVDEVGQFIANDIQRMLSLQTIAEALLSKTGGHAFMMVTSQVDINATIGDLNKRQKHDFSRIQGRFKVKIPLTSANADEVIKKRILLKNEAGNTFLEKIYAKEQNNIKILFNFGNKSQFKTVYKSVSDFQNTFPFIAYQFDLFQQAIIELNKNNAFTGNQQSVGERSMLAVTQQIAKEYKDKDIDKIIQFGDMFSGIRDILQVKAQSDILQAERSLGNPLALKTLKALFLVKYVKGFQPTVDNITRIMLPAFDTDFIEYKSEIQTALNKLEQQSYIERAVGDEYHFLTNEEKDIENEIKNTDLVPDAVNKELSKMLFADIYSESKIRVNNNPRLNYPYGHFIDGIQEGKIQDSYLHFLTPMNDYQYTDSTSALQFSMNNGNHLIVALGENKTLSQDLLTYLKADKCLNYIQSSTTDEYKKQIILDKRKLNADRRREIVRKLSELIGDAHLYICGQELIDITAKDIKTRLTTGLQQLIVSVYNNLKLLTKDYDEKTLNTLIKDQNPTGEFGYQLEECDTEVLNFIARNKANSIRSIMKDTLNHFKDIPYGWYDNATQCILVKLYKMNNIIFRYDGSLLEDRDLITYLTTSSQQAKIVLELEESIPESKLRKLKTIYQEFFDKPSTKTDAKALHQEFIQEIGSIYNGLSNLENKYQYNFTHSLGEIIKYLHELKQYSYPYAYGHLKELEETLLDAKEDFIDPIKDFVNGHQFIIFKNIETMKTGNTANLSYVDSELKELIDQVYTSKSPWKLMTKAKEAEDKISKQITEKLNNERILAQIAIEEKETAICNMEAFPLIDKPIQEQLLQPYAQLQSRVANERFIGNIIAFRGGELKTVNNRCVDEINQWIERENNKTTPLPISNQRANQGPTTFQEPPRKIKITVQLNKALSISFEKSRLSTQEDVNAYVEAIRKNMMDIINHDKNIML